MNEELYRVDAQVQFRARPSIHSMLHQNATRYNNTEFDKLLDYDILSYSRSIIDAFSMFVVVLKDVKSVMLVVSIMCEAWHDYTVYARQIAAL